MAGEADNVSFVSASACHIGGPIYVNPGELALVYCIAIQNVITGTIAVLYYFGILILWHFRTNAINPQPCTLSLYVLMRPLYTISKANSAHFY